MLASLQLINEFSLFTHIADVSLKLGLQTKENSSQRSVFEGIKFYVGRIVWFITPICGICYLIICRRNC